MKMTETDVRSHLANTFASISRETPLFHGDLLARATSAYEGRRRKTMSPALKAILQKTLIENTRMLQQQGKDQRAIQSAAEDLTSVDNPISMLFNLASILVPNYAFNEVVGVQPMPSDPAPIFYPQLTAAEARNNVASGDVLLGSTAWNQHLNFTQSKITRALDVDAKAAIDFTASELNIKKGSVRVSLNLVGIGTFVTTDDGKGVLKAISGISAAGTVNYDTGDVDANFLAATPAGSTGSITYRYEPAPGTKPAQAKFEWASRSVHSDRYSIRSVYGLENFYAARQVLADYNIDEAMATSLAGYINAEISENIFDEILAQTDATYVWDSSLPVGVSWATHRLSVLQTLVNAGNGIRSNVRRSGGDTITADTDLMSVIETLGKDLWEPEGYASEPIGPYLAGKLAGKFKVIKNQNYPSGESAMTFKKDDTDASFISGVFIGLFSTNPLALDDLTSVSGMGARIGNTKGFDGGEEVQVACRG